MAGTSSEACETGSLSLAKERGSQTLRIVETPHLYSLPLCQGERREKNRGSICTRFDVTTRLLSFALPHILCPGETKPLQIV